MDADSVGPAAPLSGPGAGGGGLAEADTPKKQNFQKRKDFQTVIELTPRGLIKMLGCARAPRDLEV